MVASAHNSAAAGPSVRTPASNSTHPSTHAPTHARTQVPATCSALHPAALSLPQPTGSPNTLPAEQLEAHGAELCQRSVMTLFDNNASVKAALEAGTEPQPTCADWEMAGGAGFTLGLLLQLFPLLSRASSVVVEGRWGGLSDVQYIVYSTKQMSV